MIQIAHFFENILLNIILTIFSLNFIRGFWGFGAQNQKGASQAKLESHVTGKTVDVSLHVPEEELKQAWEQQRAAIARACRNCRNRSPPPGRAPSTRSALQKQASAPAAPNYSRRTPVSRESKIVSDDDGNTVELHPARPPVIRFAISLMRHPAAPVTPPVSFVTPAIFAACAFRGAALRPSPLARQSALSAACYPARFEGFVHVFHS